MGLKKKFAIILSLIIFSRLFAQTTITYNGSGNYILIEKTDLRRYDNGRYTGLVSREISSYIIPVECSDGYLYEGNFYVWQDTMRSSVSLTGSVNDVILSKFKINKDGNLTMLLDYGYPSFRSFPSYSTNKIKKGDKWQAKAERAVDPLGKGVITKMPIYVEYQYINDATYGLEDCYVISAQWATRYGMGSGTYYIDWGGDQDLQKATGSHKALIYVSKYSGNALLIKDTVDETFIYTDGNQIQFKGQISQFTEYPPAVDRSKLIPALKRIADISKEMEDELLHGKNDLTATDGKELAMKDFNNSDEKSGIANFSENSDTYEITKGDLAGGSEKSGLAKGDLADGSENSGLAKGELNNKDETSGITKDKSNRLEALKQSVNSVNSEKKEKTENSKQTDGKASNALVTVDNTPAGIRLTIPNLQFKPDSAQLLDGENDRLSKLADVLKEVPDCKFLIEGHTASVGKVQGEMQLSLERAHAIAQALINRGIKSERIICKGSGGTKPIADNSTAEGKAKNRRVEITILE